jgi:hypothetical protein
MNAPDTIEGDPDALEILRLWIAHEKLNVAIKIGHYEENGHDEAEAWGIIVADFAKHVSRALHQRYAKAPEETLRKIRDQFLAELEEPTSDAEGE